MDPARRKPSKLEEKHLHHGSSAGNIPENVVVNSFRYIECRREEPRSDRLIRDSGYGEQADWYFEASGLR